jgi:pimeloyl-ACP methyl ester carboxylesterase
MTKLEIGDWQQRPYGERAKGVATVGSHSVRFTVRRPRNGQTEGLHYVLPNGWTAGKNSMRLTALSAVTHGNTAYTFDYTNRSLHHALDRNVSDAATIVEALPEDARVGMVGLSMGGAVTTHVIDRLGNRVEHATLVASGKYLKPEFYAGKLILKHAASHSADALLHHGKLTDGVRLLGTGALNCAERYRAVLGEIWDLTHGNVHDELRRIKGQSDAPVMHFAYGSHDKLLPAYAQLQSIEGLPFDEVWEYQGGHNRLATDPGLAADVFALHATQLAA